MQGRHHRAKGCLAGVAGQGIHRAIDRIDPRLGGGENRARGDARRIVGVEVDRQAGFFFERLYQRACGCGFHQAAHILDAQDVGARGLQFLGHLHVVLQIIFRTGGVIDIARVAQHAFQNALVLQHRIHGHPHVLHPVERIKDAEQVNARVGRLFDEGLHHIVGVVRVAHTV